MLHRADILDDGIEWEHFDFFNLGLFLFELRSLGNPSSDNFIIIVTGFGELSAFVRHGRGRFQKHETVIGRGQIDAAGRDVVGESADIINRIVSAQGKFKAVFSILGSVAGSGITAHTRHDRVYVLGPSRDVILIHAGHFNWDRGLATGEAEFELSFSIGDPADDPGIRDLGLITACRFLCNTSDVDDVA